MEIKITLSSKEYKELQNFCSLNKLNEEEVVKKSFTTGLKIEMYGLLNPDSTPQEKIVEKEVVKYVEVIKEVEVPRIEYVEVEKPVEVIKEIIKEIPVEVIKEVEKIFQDDSKLLEEREKFSTITEEMENIFQKEKQELLDKISELENKKPDLSKQKALEATLQKLKADNIQKENKIKELENIISQQNPSGNQQGVLLRGSNLKDKLF